MECNNSNNIPEPKSHVFLVKPTKKEKKQYKNMYIPRQFVLQYFSEIKQQTSKTIYVFNQKNVQKNYLPSKFNLLTK